jgi:signal transduction histidine kinase
MDLRVLGSELVASFRALMEAADMQLDLQIDQDLHLVHSDRKKIRQIITNLVTNAIRYCRKDNSNSTVVLAFRSFNQDAWQIVVEDCGTGIPAEHLDSIFDEFKRGSHSPEIKGAGLGLAITKRLVEELKGTIEVFSEMGQGSRFVVTLPGAPSH